MYGVALGNCGAESPNSTAANALGILRKFGSNAHVYIPGANGVAVSGLTTGNYTDQTLTTYASVDGTIGGVVDATGGINATQSVAGNRPGVRRGLYNLLTYSNDLTNAAWVTEFTASKSGNTLLLPATSDDVYRSSTVSAGTYTLYFLLSGSGTVSLYAYNATNGIHGVTQVTLTSTPTVYAATITSTVANSAYYLGRRPGDTATSVVFGGGGLSAGTLTAQQILSEGGIALTTSAAASNQSTGRYWWQFDGVNDQLVCASAPFQITDDFAIVVAVNANTIAGFPGVLSVDDGGSTNAVALYLNSGVPTAYVMAGGTLQAATAGPAITAGSAYVLSIVKTGSSLKIRKNGVDGTTVSTVGVGSAAFTAMRIGYQPVGLAYWSGAIGEPMFIKGTVSASDLSTLERQVASTFPAAPTF